MADKRLTELPLLGAITTGTSWYAVESSQSFRGVIDQLASIIVNNYGVLTNDLPANFMTVSNAELILNGLNNASSATLGEDRLDISSLFFDVDGGNFYDTYVNTSTFDGGLI